MRTHTALRTASGALVYAAGTHLAAALHASGALASLLTTLGLALMLLGVVLWRHAAPLAYWHRTLTKAMEKGGRHG